ncbi:MAG: C40 family peptidase [Bacteroidota bacterium]
MKSGICVLNAIPLRKEADNKSELVSQILFGETFRIIRSEKHWLQIECDYDNYQGWVLKNQIEELNEEFYLQISNSDVIYTDELVSFLSEKNNLLTTISLGASLPLLQQNTFNINNKEFHFEGENKTGVYTKSEIVKTAYLYLNSPFLWGGKTPFGLDCSGFTQMAYRINGHFLYRDAHQQAGQGEVLSFIEESEAGDLAFFDDEEGNIIHVGIILHNNHIIHCHGKVRIDRLDQSGIFNIDTKRHTHNLRIIKKIF